jgi:L-ascorbate metabolism protein UlaG (beta-lactamase superfamily)
MNVRYLGTATLLLEYAGLRVLTDPAFDPAGVRYDFGPWYAPRAWFASEKQYETPMRAADVGVLDAVLLSHDHHADNLDPAGRRLLAEGAGVVYTTPAGARRLRSAAPTGRASAPGEGLGLGERARGVRWGERVRVERGGRGFWLTATPARHGPAGTPQVHEVNGWLLEADDVLAEPTVWISGDTVLFPALLRALASLRAEGRRVDVAVVHCGGVRFPRVPLLGRALFTFDAAQVATVCRALEPRTIVPVHRTGWAHFRQPEEQLRAALAAAGLGERCAFLALGEARELAR